MEIIERKISLINLLSDCITINIGDNLVNINNIRIIKICNQNVMAGWKSYSRPCII